MRESSRQSSAWQRLLGRIKRSFFSKKRATTSADAQHTTAPKSTSTAPQNGPVSQHVPKQASDSFGGQHEPPRYEPVKVQTPDKNDDQDASKNPNFIQRSLSRKKRNPSDGAATHKPSMSNPASSEPYVPRHAGTDFSRMPNQPTQLPPGPKAESTDYQDFLDISRIADRQAAPAPSSGFINASASEAEALRVKTCTPANPYASEREQKMAMLPESPPFQVPARPESRASMKQGLSRSGSKRVAGKIAEKVGEYVKPTRQDSVSNRKRRGTAGDDSLGGVRASAEDKRYSRLSGSSGTRGSTPEMDRRLTSELEPLSEIRDRPSP